MTKIPEPMSDDGKRRGDCYLHFSFIPDPDPDCCELCHKRKMKSHRLAKVEFWTGMDEETGLCEVCGPVAERLRGLGYVFQDEGSCLTAPL